MFFLDILSHRMSEMAMLRQQPFRETTNFLHFIDLPISPT